MEFHINESLGLKAQALVSETPSPRRTRIKGKLNALAYLERGVLLKLADGNRLHVLWGPENLEPLRNLWGGEVLLEGMLQFKANGKPQILVVDAIRAAGTQDSFWTELPSAHATMSAMTRSSLVLWGLSAS